MTQKPYITIEGKKIGEEYSPYFIAELSANHQLCIEQARAMIRAAKASGADAVKLQTYTADTVTLPVRNEQFSTQGPWKNAYLYDLYKTNYTPWEWHEELAEFAQKLKITLFSSPFDESAVDFLEKTIHPPAYKIASFEMNHIPLLKKVAATGKPILLSTGLSVKEEIEEAVQVLRDNGCKELLLLKCIGAHSDDLTGCNLKCLDYLKTFNCPVGISDHSVLHSVVMGGIAMGASLIEKHFILSRSSDAADGDFSLDPKEFEQMVKEGRRLFKGLGDDQLIITKNEEARRKFRRSIYVSAPIKKGEIFSPQNIKIIRPHFGLHPRYWEKILGKVAKKDLDFGHPLSMDDVVDV